MSLSERRIMWFKVLTSVTHWWKKPGSQGAREHLTAARDLLVALRCPLAAVSYPLAAVRCSLAAVRYSLAPRIPGFFHQCCDLHIKNTFVTLLLGCYLHIGFSIAVSEKAPQSECDALPHLHVLSPSKSGNITSLKTGLRSRSRKEPHVLAIWSRSQLKKKPGAEAAPKKTEAGASINSGTWTGS